MGTATWPLICLGGSPREEPVFRRAALLIALLVAVHPTATLFCPASCDRAPKAQTARCHHGSTAASIGAAAADNCRMSVGVAVLVPEDARRAIAAPGHDQADLAFGTRSRDPMALAQRIWDPGPRWATSARPFSILRL